MTTAWSSRGNDIWGKYVLPKPEETMSRKKNRHEVPDLIKRDTSTCEREMKGRGTFVGFCKGLVMMRLTLPSGENLTKILLQGTPDPYTWRIGPHQEEAPKQNPCSLSRGSPRTQEKNEKQEFELVQNTQERPVPLEWHISTLASTKWYYSSWLFTYLVRNRYISYLKATDSQPLNTSLC